MVDHEVWGEGGFWGEASGRLKGSKGRGSITDPRTSPGYRSPSLGPLLNTSIPTLLALGFYQYRTEVRKIQWFREAMKSFEKTRNRSRNCSELCISQVLRVVDDSG